MKQNLEDYIRHDEKFRQTLLNQEGGIMKYWAQHPDAEFDTVLFENYEKQIVDVYLQANKRNRAVALLSERELKLKAREWYHLTEKELHYIIVLQPVLVKMPKEIREQANSYMGDYLVDAYKDYRRNYYPDGIPPLDYYKEVINEYGIGGLARDCMDFVIREHQDPEAWQKARSEYSLMREFFVRQFSDAIEEEGDFKKLRQGVKEILAGKNTDECRSKAIKTMNLVKDFSRMIYSSSKVIIGDYVVDKEWLRELTGTDAALRLISQKDKIPPLHDCFFNYVQTLNDIGRIWAAQLLVRGIDMHELEKETGSVLFPVSEPSQWPDGADHGNYRYYVDKNLDDKLDDQCCIYDEKQAKKLLDALRNKQLLEKSDEFAKQDKVHVTAVTATSASQDKVGCGINSKAELSKLQVDQDTPPPPSAEGKLLLLPENVNGSRAQEYFKKAIENGWVEVHDGKYRWIGFKSRNGTPNATAWAYFCDQAYGYNLFMKNDISLPADELEVLFNMPKGTIYKSNYRIVQIHNTPKWKVDIDTFFTQHSSPL